MQLDTEYLLQQLQINLIGFLRIELKVGATMLETARTTTDDNHRKQLMKDVRSAIAAVRQFEGRVQDRRVAQRFLVAADRLEREVSGVRQAVG
jgi:hypothetical protein